MNDVEKAAVDVLHKSGWVEWKCEETVSTLSRAGLLATPLMLQALEACKAYAGSKPNAAIGSLWPVGANEVLAIGREALELEKPKERWTTNTCGCVFLDGKMHVQFYGDLCHQMASAYAAQKNAEEAARREGGR